MGGERRSWFTKREPAELRMISELTWTDGTVRD